MKAIIKKIRDKFWEILKWYSPIYITLFIVLALVSVIIKKEISLPFFISLILDTLLFVYLLKLIFRKEKRIIWKILKWYSIVLFILEFLAYYIILIPETSKQIISLSEQIQNIVLPIPIAIYLWGLLFRPEIKEELPPQKPETKTKRILKKIFWSFVPFCLWYFISLLIRKGINIFLAFSPNLFNSYIKSFGWDHFWIIILSSNLIISFVISFIILKKVSRKRVVTILVVIASLLFVSFLSQVSLLDTTMMFQGNGLEPYLHDNQYLIIQKFNKSINKGDIVVLQEKLNNKSIVGIVIGLPGDKIELKNGTFFVNNAPLENIAYDFKQSNGIDDTTGNYYLIVPPDSFYAIPANIDPSLQNKLINLHYYLYPKSFYVGKLIYPWTRFKVTPSNDPRACNGYSPISCPPDAKYYCPQQGKPFCCKEKLVNGLCIECPAGRILALYPNKNLICCDKNLVCNGKCYSCPAGQKFYCSPKRGGYCYEENSIFCNGEYWSPCPAGEKFHCPKAGEPFCYKIGENICNDKPYIPCPAGQKFYCPPTGEPYCQ